MTSTLVGGVGQLYQGDLDVGRLAAERLAREDLGPAVLVEELHYGAVAVAQRLEDLHPYTLVLVGAEPRDRVPGTVERRRVREPAIGPEQAQIAVGDAVTGYVSIDLVVEVAWALGALPARTVAVEVEPVPITGPSEQLSPPARAGLEHACELVRAEVRRAPVLELADELRSGMAEGTHHDGLHTQRALLDELRLLDEEGRWGATFRLRDQLRSDIATGTTGDDMDKLDWVRWWTLIEELGRIQSLEAR